MVHRLCVKKELVDKLGYAAQIRGADNEEEVSRPNHGPDSMKKAFSMIQAEEQGALV